MWRQRGLVVAAAGLVVARGGGWLWRQRGLVVAAVGGGAAGSRWRQRGLGNVWVERGACLSRRLDGLGCSCAAIDVSAETGMSLAS